MGRNGRFKTKHRTRDVDQIFEDIKTDRVQRRIAEATIIDEDLPGMGQFFCVSCAKYFIDQQAFEIHKSCKPHKQRLRLLQETPHCQEDADRAAGLLRAN